MARHRISASMLIDASPRLRRRDGDRSRLAKSSAEHELSRSRLRAGPGTRDQRAVLRGGIVTTFTVEPRYGGRSADVTISTVTDVGRGLAGVAGRWVATRVLHPCTCKSLIDSPRSRPTFLPPDRSVSPTLILSVARASFAATLARFAKRFVAPTKRVTATPPQSSVRSTQSVKFGRNETNERSMQTPATSVACSAPAADVACAVAACRCCERATHNTSVGARRGRTAPLDSAQRQRSIRIHP